ncbi:MAG: TraC family protein, partial [Lentisphaeria bacterium]|nr:TraC family protein [Lentisphaeria bacterium]
MNLDDGYYHDGMMIWFKGFCTKGYMLAAPDLLNSSSEMLHEQEDNLRGLLSSLPDNCKVQFSWGCNSDYRDVLDHYYDDTMKLAKEEWSFTTRMERYERYKKKMDAGDLRREKLFLYITLPLGSAARPKPADLNTSNVKAMRAFFDNVQHMIKLHLSACGIKAMDETDYYMNHLCFFNPCADNILGDNLSGYDPEKTILENTYRSDVLGNTPTSEEPFSMFFDSHYHSIMVMSRAPSFTYMGQIFILTSLPFLNYRITINLEYQPIEKEISNTERIIKRLSGEFNADPSKQGHVESIKQARQKIANLSDGSLKPMKFELYIHIWGIDKTEVQTKTAAIKAAIKKMDSADLTEASLDTQAIGMFARTIPGSGVNHPYNYYKLYCESNYIAALIPYSSTFRAFEKAEALYDGNNNNLVGLVNFLGTTPQHCAVFGSSGSGKSALMCDLLSQTEPYYGFTAIIEEGVSYGIYTLAYGQTPLIIHPEADITINYLDTSQLPLGPRQIGTATAFAGQMAGKSGNEERDNFRHGLLQYFITELYQSSADDWRLKNPELFLEAASLARASQRYLEMIMPPGSSLQEAYFEYRDKRNDLKDEYEDHTPEELSNYILDPRTAEHAMNFCFIFYQAEDYPTHSDLCQYIMIFDDPSRMSREDQKTLIALMEVWQAGGSYGTLFDGPSNVTIKDKIAHFELGYIDEGDE